MEVPKFSGLTSWDQYRQVFDAIVHSNGWDDATVALQLLSHLEGEALNVALLVPEAQRATRAGLVRALTEHYGSPGRLADYRYQFEKTARNEGDDLSIFAIDLETLAVKAFGEMGVCQRNRSWQPLLTAPSLGLGDIEALLRHLLPTAPVQTPPPHPVPTETANLME